MTAPSRTPAFDPIESLEPRRYLANPAVLDFSVDPQLAYPGQEITLTAHVTADNGVRAVVFWIEDNGDALNQFIAHSFDQPLGDVFMPDAGTTDRYSIRVTVGASWTSTVKFGVDVVDVDGNYSQQPINFVTVQNPVKPFIIGMRAEMVAGGNIHLVATASVNGERITSTGIAGVTFFLDQNGNNQWDIGGDIDLGVGTMTGNGVYEKAITPQGGWNLTWFAASAFDTRAGPDRFGPNHSAVLRGDLTPPSITFLDIIPPDNDTHSAVYSSDEVLRLFVQFEAPATLQGGTFFHDRNRNGLWDVGVDAPLQQYFTSTSPTTGFFDLFLRLGRLGHGWESVGIAVHDASGRGDDSWSSASTLWINIDNTPWIEDGSITPDPVPAGTPSIDFTFRVRDDDGVMGPRQAFIDLDGDGGFVEAGEPLGTNLTYLNPGRANALWRLTFNTQNLSPGTYNINIWLQDYREIQGPRYILTFIIIP